MVTTLHYTRPLYKLYTIHDILYTIKYRVYTTHYMRPQYAVYTIHNALHIKPQYNRIYTINCTTSNYIVVHGLVTTLQGNLREMQRSIL